MVRINYAQDRDRKKNHFDKKEEKQHHTKVVIIRHGEPATEQETCLTPL